mmetsp:Transcript_12366/g.25115  ORF Transcript_12366/g.25115 Transcript_12366/m.25115 type:complete len:113 (-) Transcript_12366:748-1086(-)
MLDTSNSDTMAPRGTEVNKDNFDTVLGSNGLLPRQQRKSGRNPICIICFTECCVGLVFLFGRRSELWNEGYVNEANVFVSQIFLELTKRFNKRHRFYVSKRPSKFNDANFWW